MRVLHLMFKGAGGYLRYGTSAVSAHQNSDTDLNFHVHFHYKDAYLSLILGHVRLGIVTLIIRRVSLSHPSSPDGM